MYASTQNQYLHKMCMYVHMRIYIRICVCVYKYMHMLCVFVVGMMVRGFKPTSASVPARGQISGALELLIRLLSSI